MIDTSRLEPNIRYEIRLRWTGEIKAAYWTGETDSESAGFWVYPGDKVSPCAVIAVREYNFGSLPVVSLDSDREPTFEERLEILRIKEIHDSNMVARESCEPESPDSFDINSSNEQGGPDGWSDQ